MEYLVIVFIAVIVITYRWKNSRSDYTEAITGFIKHLIEKQDSYTNYHRLANEQSMNAFAERLKIDFKLRMDKKLYSHANWMTIAETIKAYLNQYMEDIDV